MRMRDAKERDRERTTDSGNGNSAIHGFSRPHRETVAMLIRVPPDLAKRVHDKAEKDKRTITMTVEMLLEKGLR